jgi:hypothetical protein
MKTVSLMLASAAIAILTPSAAMADFCSIIAVPQMVSECRKDMTAKGNTFVNNWMIRSVRGQDKNGNVDTFRQGKLPVVSSNMLSKPKVVLSVACFMDKMEMRMEPLDFMHWVNANNRPVLTMSIDGGAPFQEMWQMHEREIQAPSDSHLASKLLGAKTLTVSATPRPIGGKAPPARQWTYDVSGYNTVIKTVCGNLIKVSR